MHGAATKASVPMGVPSATRRRGGQAVVHSGFALVGSDARVRRYGARKGSVQVGCAFGGAADVDVGQVRCHVQQLPVTQVGTCGAI